MSVEKYRQNISELKEGMALAEYNMLREKAMRNETLIQSDGQGGTVEVSARELFEKLCGEPAPTF